MAGLPEQEPSPARTAERNLYFGDTHAHTAYSFDAYLLGNTLGPDSAYRYAKGEEVITATELKRHLDRPLDFLAVSDHGVFLGVVQEWADPSSKVGRQTDGGDRLKTREAIYDVACADDLAVDPATHRCPDNGAAVSPADCELSDDTGASELKAVWADPDFDPSIKFSSSMKSNLYRTSI